MSAEDRITLRGLRVRGHHGVLAEERAQGQDFVLDVSLVLDTRSAAATDDLDRTVDYSRLARVLADVVAGEPVALLETLAQRLADACLSDARVAAVDVTVHKPQAPMPVPVAVSVSIRRSRA